MTQTEHRFSDRLQCIREVFNQKKLKNPSYSMRSFAKELEVSPTLLSLVFSGKRSPSANLILSFQKKFSAQTASAGTPKTKPQSRLAHYPSPEFVLIDPPEQLCHWYEVAILDLLTLDSFQPDVKWIANRLGISQKQTLDGVEKLSLLSLIDTKGGGIQKKNKKVSLKTRHSLQSIRQIHREFIQKALVELDQTDQTSFNKRRISGTTMAINPKRLEEAKAKVDAFQQELTDFLTQGKCSELYQINLQLFPLLR